jgi:hypothetical protein
VRVLAPLFSLGLFICCMACHGELARSKPEPARLTAFYLAVSAGGVLGGVLVGVVAPHAFDDYHELPLAFVGTAACLAWVVMREAARTAQGSARLAQGLLLAVVPLVLAYRVADRLADRVDPAESVARNFFGTLKLRDTGTGDGAYRALYHGGTEHGGQYAAAALRSTPTSYYAKESGVGQALLAVQAGKPVKVGVIGLGTGTIAAYSRAGDEFRFYDINPLVVDIARSKFALPGRSQGPHGGGDGRCPGVAGARTRAALRRAGGRRVLGRFHPHPPAHRRGLQRVLPAPLAAAPYQPSPNRNPSMTPVPQTMVPNRLRARRRTPGPPGRRRCAHRARCRSGAPGSSPARAPRPRPGRRGRVAQALAQPARHRQVLLRQQEERAAQQRDGKAMPSVVKKISHGLTTWLPHGGPGVIGQHADRDGRAIASTMFSFSGSA